MSKITTMVATMGGIMLLCYFTGILPSSSATGALMSIVLNPGNIQNLSIVTAISGIIVIASLFGTVFFSRFTPSDFYVVTPMVTLFLSFGYDFLQIFNALGSGGVVFQMAAVLIFGPLMLIYVIGVVEWWRGGV